MRFEKSNAQRAQAGHSTYPIDERLQEALQKGIPDCSGVAVGFDRLMMLRHKQSEIQNVLPFAWEEA